MTRRMSISSVLRQLSPRSSIEFVSETHQTDDHVEVTVPASWLEESRLAEGELILTDGEGRERRVALDAPVHGSPALETFGSVAVMLLSCDEARPVPAKEPMTNPARVTRHLGRRGAIGAA